MNEIEELKKRAGISEQRPDRVKAYMDMRSFLAFAKDVTDHVDQGAYDLEVLDSVANICNKLGQLAKNKMRG